MTTMPNLDELLSHLIDVQRNHPMKAHAGVIAGNLTATYQLQPFDPVLEPEKPSTPGVGAPHFGPLRFVCDTLDSFGTGDRQRIILGDTGPAAGVYYVGTVPYFPPFKPSFRLDDAPPIEIPLPAFERHLYALLADGTLRVIAQRDGAGPDRDDTYAWEEWPTPCQVGSELLRLYRTADICGYGRLPVLREARVS